MATPWSIRLVRVLFLTLAVLLGAVIAEGFKVPVWQGTLGGLTAGLFFILVDSLLAQFSFREFSNGTFGLLVGIFCAWLITKIGFFDLPWFRALEDTDAVRSVVDISIYAIFAFLGITMALRSDRDQFSFIIPYVRFRRDASEGEPVLLDSNIIVDGRLLSVYATGFLVGSFVIPRFVLDELQRLVDSRDPIKAARGKRGLDNVQKMREHAGMEFTIHEDTGRENESVDTRLITLARELSARLLTNDINLGKSAQAQGVNVLNFNQLTHALQPEVHTGDEMELLLVKAGKDRHQAIGYLPNGAMIVVNHAAAYIGETMPIVVSGAHQTSAGRLIFAELNSEKVTTTAHPEV